MPIFDPVYLLIFSSKSNVPHHLLSQLYTLFLFLPFSKRNFDQVRRDVIFKIRLFFPIMQFFRQLLVRFWQTHRIFFNRKLISFHRKGICKATFRARTPQQKQLPTFHFRKIEIKRQFNRDLFRSISILPLLKR